MFKRLSTQTKTFIFVTVVVFSFTAILIRSFDVFLEHQHRFMHTRSYQHINIFYNYVLNEYQLSTERMVRRLQSPDILEAFATHNRHRLYELTFPIWDSFKQDEHHSNVIHYHLPNGNSFLRMHEPDKYDDNISALRVALRHIHQHQEPIVGFEKGVYALAYRTFTPLFYDNRYIGAVEFGTRPDYILDRFQKSYDLQGMIFVQKNALNLYQEQDIAPLSIGNYTLQFSNLSKHDDLIHQLQTIHYGFDNIYGLEIKDKIYNLYSFDMKDFQNVAIAKIIIIEDVTMIYNNIDEHLQLMHFVINLMRILILVIVYFGFRRMMRELKKHKQPLQ